MTQRSLIKTAIQQPGTPSKQQKAFNTLIKQIEASRAQLLAWESASQAYQDKYSRVMVPLVETLQGLQVEFVQQLDRASCESGLSKAERGVIDDLIVDLARELIEVRGDEVLKAIYNKHSRTDYDREEAARMRGVKAMLEDALGVELDADFDTGTPEEIMQRARAQFDAMQAREEAERQVREARKAATRKKSAKQLDYEARQQAEAQQISQSIREVYRKLASLLHPDRESDPMERDRKTGLMKRANLAYARKDLLQLLELQLEVELIDQAGIGQISEDRLKHYILILKDQQSELTLEIRRNEAEFKARFGLDPSLRLSPGNLMSHLKDDIRDAQFVIKDIGKDLRMFNDFKRFKTWLKGMRRRTVRDDDLDF